MDTVLRDKAREAICARRDQLVGLSHDIHEHPEIAFFEQYAADRITQFLTDQGFAIRKGLCAMPTAFIATIGGGPLHLAFCAEYDALPPACLFDRSKRPALREVWLGPELQDIPLRHACGHNLIAGAAVTAAMALKDIVDEAGLTVSVIGTPGEELCGLPDPPEGRLAGGKIALFEGGAFEGVHAVLMVHPGQTPWSMYFPTHAFLRLRGRFSPGAARGHVLGVVELRRLEQALERTVLALRQIPALFAARPEHDAVGAQADLLWISTSESEAKKVCNAVRSCFEEAASTAGVEVQISEYALDGELRNDPLLSASYRENSRILGREREREKHIQEEIRAMFSSSQLPLATRLIAPLLRIFPRLVAPPGLFMDQCPVEIVYGTDLAPVSQMVPCIHPLIGIGGIVGVHSLEFAAQADTAEAYRAMLDGGVALAWTALDAATNPAIRSHLLDSASDRNGSKSKQN